MVFIPQGGETAQTKKYKTMDMSAGGIRVETDAEVDLGSFVALQIALPDRTDSIDVFAKVVWIRPTPGGQHLVGLRFLSSSEESLGALKGYLEPRLK
jgi:Tfp pilus assembly protein PilZ